MAGEAAAEDVYATLVLNGSYLPGAMVLGHSLRDVGTKKKLVALVTLDTLSLDSIDELKTIYHILPVERISNPAPANLWLMGRPDLIHAFTKIALWRQTQYRKIVYLDSDIVVLQNLDELFGLEAPFAAAPDIGWPDAFNSGMMVITPDMGEYWALQTMAQSGDSFDGADQGLLNQYYEHRGWHRLSYTYNTTPSAHYQWEPAYRYYKSKIKAAHFIGKDKPWLVGRHASSGSGTHNELVSRWWSVYDRHYRQTPQYVAGQTPTRSTAVQQRVFGEALDVYYGLPPEERLPPLPSTEIASSSFTPAPTAPDYHAPPPQTSHTAPHSEPHHTHAPEIVVQEPSPGETHPQPPSEHQQHHHQPTPPPQEPEKHFSPPPAEWDATRSAPPSASRPEAENFPREHYTFEGERGQFRAPQQYPDAPKDMWYSVPESKPEPEQPPPAIFPWEKRHRPQTSRVFADDHPPSPVLSPGSPTTWEANAGGIDRYIKNIREEQAARKTSVPQYPDSAVLSPQPGRRESLIITGFPPTDARPSLPVTPAPILHHTLWGEDAGEPDPSLPSAEGVPDQAEWNPAEKLEELRRSSLIEFENLVLPIRRPQEPDIKEEQGEQKTTAASGSGKNGSSLKYSTELDESAVVKALEKAAEQNPPISPESVEDDPLDISPRGSVLKPASFAAVQFASQDPTGETPPKEGELSPTSK